MFTGGISESAGLEKTTVGYRKKDVHPDVVNSESSWQTPTTRTSRASEFSWMNVGYNVPKPPSTHLQRVHV